MASIEMESEVHRGRYCVLNKHSVVGTCEACCKCNYVLSLRLDLELEALGSAWDARKEGGAPGPIARRILSVGLSRQGMLDPSPSDPFWVGQLLARVGRKAGRKARSTLRPH